MNQKKAREQRKTNNSNSSEQFDNNIKLSFYEAKPIIEQAYNQIIKDNLNKQVSAEWFISKFVDEVYKIKKDYNVPDTFFEGFKTGFWTPEKNIIVIGTQSANDRVRAEALNFGHKLGQLIGS